MPLLLALTFVVAGVMSWWLASTRGYWQVLDIPNERSLHSLPTPRTGGIAILLGIAAGVVSARLWGGYSVMNLPLVAAVLVLAGVAFLDERRALGIVPRLLTQIAAVSMLLFTQTLVVSDGLSVIVSLLFLVWMINLYNFMDGMDGLAAGMAIFGFSTFALLSWQAGYAEFALGCAIIAAASSGFLLLNFPPARLFMGDTGSTSLGLLAGVAILFAHQEAILPLWLGLVVFSPFVVDASVTISARILGGEKFWLAHKTHYYQRLVRIGWGRRRTMLAAYGLMLACGATAIASANTAYEVQCFIVAAWSVLYVAAMLLIRRAERSKERKHDTVRTPP